jgi:hypothetical protein
MPKRFRTPDLPKTAWLLITDHKKMITVNSQNMPSDIIKKTTEKLKAAVIQVPVQPEET